MSNDTESVVSQGVGIDDDHPDFDLPRPMSRAEHVAWAKSRAKEYAERGDMSNALASLTSDLSKHPDTEGHAAIELGMLLAFGGHLSTRAQLVEFVDGVN